ncbi:UNVERIFIED_ORG: hemolysin expression modulating protein [Rahnella aquatilis]
MQAKTRNDYLMQFRRCTNVETLGTVYESLNHKLSGQDAIVMCGAYDHRKVELKLGKLYDKVPASAWKLITD